MSTRGWLLIVELSKVIGKKLLDWYCLRTLGYSSQPPVEPKARSGPSTNTTPPQDLH
jgi:hypothetical protein